MELVIKRRYWLRGSGEYSALKSGNEYCCLGFFAKACGFKNKDIDRTCTPDEIYGNVETDESTFKDFYNNLDPNFKFLINPKTQSDTKICLKLMEVNDKKYLSDEEREKKLTALFAKKGVEVKFV